MVSEYSHCGRMAGAVRQVQHSDLAHHVHVTATEALLAFGHPETDTHERKELNFTIYLCTGFQFLLFLGMN